MGESLIAQSSGGGLKFPPRRTSKAQSPCPRNSGAALSEKQGSAVAAPLVQYRPRPARVPRRIARCLPGESAVEPVFPEHRVSTSHCSPGVRTTRKSGTRKRSTGNTRPQSSGSRSSNPPRLTSRASNMASARWPCRSPGSASARSTSCATRDTTSNRLCCGRQNYPWLVTIAALLVVTVIWWVWWRLPKQQAASF